MFRRCRRVSNYHPDREDTLRPETTQATPYCRQSCSRGDLPTGGNPADERPRKHAAPLHRVRLLPPPCASPPPCPPPGFYRARGLVVRSQGRLSKVASSVCQRLSSRYPSTASCAQHEGRSTQVSLLLGRADINPPGLEHVARGGGHLKGTNKMEAQEWRQSCQHSYKG